LIDAIAPQLRARQSLRQKSGRLDFLSNKDKEWVMGRVILERLGWK
jgi:hypothetical protein